MDLTFSFDDNQPYEHMGRSYVMKHKVYFLHLKIFEEANKCTHLTKKDVTLLFEINPKMLEWRPEQWI